METSVHVPTSRLAPDVSSIFLLRSFSRADRSSTASAQERIFCSLFSIMPKDPSPLRHPFSQSRGLLRRRTVLRAIEFARLTCERLNPTGTVTSELLIEREAVCEVFDRGLRQKYRKRESVFDRLTGSLSDVRDHRVRCIAKERDASG